MVTCPGTHRPVLTADSKITLRETRRKGVSSWAWSLTLSRFSCNVRKCPLWIFKVFINRSVIRRGEGVDFSFWIIQNARFQFSLLLLEKHYPPPRKEKSTCPVSYTRIKAHRRNISETSSRGNTNSWHLFDRAGLQCLSCAVAKNHWKESMKLEKRKLKGGGSKKAPLA